MNFVPIEKALVVDKLGLKHLMGLTIQMHQKYLNILKILHARSISASQIGREQGGKVRTKGANMRQNRPAVAQKLL